jgi:hypothetical protein
MLAPHPWTSYVIHSFQVYYNGEGTMLITHVNMLHITNTALAQDTKIHSVL